MVGRVGDGSLTLAEAFRFPNRPVRIGGTLHWDILALYQGVLDGLRAAGPVDSIGIDSWAVDYGLLDSHGALLGNPVHYRDARTEGVAERVWETVPAEALYAVTGIQYAPFNTLYQLIAARESAQFAGARRALLIPDLVAYWLTDEQGTEITNASTTQLIDPRNGSGSTSGSSRRCGGRAEPSGLCFRRRRPRSATRRRSSPSPPTTPRRRSRLFRQEAGSGSRTSAPARGRWPDWSWTRRC
jgi:rhamnulokinase